jgi:hypothetical protein
VETERKLFEIEKKKNTTLKIDLGETIVNPHNLLLNRSELSFQVDFDKKVKSNYKTALTMKGGEGLKISKSSYHLGDQQKMPDIS